MRDIWCDYARCEYCHEVPVHDCRKATALETEAARLLTPGRGGGGGMIGKKDKIIAQLVQACRLVGTQNERLHDQIGRLHAQLKRSGHADACRVFTKEALCDCHAAKRQ